MATIYAPPKDIPLPVVDYSNYDHKAEQEKEDAFLKKLRDWCRANFKGDLVGEEICAPRADGYARYMIMRQKPFALIHLELGDAWNAGEIWERGVTLADARKMVERRRHPLFGSSKV